MSIDKSLDAMFDLNYRGRPMICVEMSGNHQGNKKAAIEFAQVAKAAGADLLKLQVYRPDTITMKSDREDFTLDNENDWAEYGTLYDLYEKAHTPWDWIADIFEEAKRIKLPIWASPFDHTAVDFLEDLNCPYYKIASPEITDLGLIEACARTGKPVVISTGLAGKKDLDEAVAVVRKYGTPLMILKCVSAYPTPIENMNVATIPWLRETYGCSVGLSDHSLGSAAVYAATAMGAAMIEKHFRLPNDNFSVDSSFSMSLDDLREMKATLTEVHKAVGKVTLKVPKIAKPSLSGRRSLYVLADVKAGDNFTFENVGSIRPWYGIKPKHLPFILGRKATRDIAAGERMSWDLVEGGKIIMKDDPVLKAFSSICINPPEGDHICIYQSGILDSGDLMQLLLEIEMNTGKRLNLTSLIEGDITLSRLREILNGAE